MRGLSLISLFVLAEYSFVQAQQEAFVARCDLASAPTLGAQTP